MATKSLSFFAVFFILFLGIFEVPEIEAQLCLREYVGEFPLSNCSAVEIPLCHTKCRESNGAKGGICYVAVEGEEYKENFKCLCNFCSEDFCHGAPAPGLSLGGI